MNYAAVIKSTSLAESKQKHTPCVRLLINANKCLESGEDVEKQFIADMWIGDRTVERTMKTLREIGWEGMSFAELNNPYTLEGTEIEISTAMEEYNGQMFEKVKFVNKKGSFENRGLKPCSEEVARNIAHRYDSVLRGGKVTKSRPNPPPGPKYGVEGEGDDDLPF